MVKLPNQRDVDEQIEAEIARIAHKCSCEAIENGVTEIQHERRFMVSPIVKATIKILEKKGYRCRKTTRVPIRGLSMVWFQVVEIENSRKVVEDMSNTQTKNASTKTRTIDELRSKYAEALEARNMRAKEHETDLKFHAANDLKQIIELATTAIGECSESIDYEVVCTTSREDCEKIVKNLREMLVAEGFDAPICNGLLEHYPEDDDDCHKYIIKMTISGWNHQ